MNSIHQRHDVLCCIVPLEEIYLNSSNGFSESWPVWLLFTLTEQSFFSTGDVGIVKQSLTMAQDSELDRAWLCLSRKWNSALKWNLWKRRTFSEPCVNLFFLLTTSWDTKPRQHRMNKGKCNVLSSWNKRKESDDLLFSQQSKWRLISNNYFCLPLKTCIWFPPLCSDIFSSVFQFF